MIQLHIPAMTCAHCVGRVTRAVQGVDPAAQVVVDLASKQVQVESSHALPELAKALEAAGYPPTNQTTG